MSMRLCLDLSQYPVTLGFSSWRFSQTWLRNVERYNFRKLSGPEGCIPLSSHAMWRFWQYSFTHVIPKKAAAARISVRPPTIWHLKPKERTQNTSVEWIVQICYSQGYLLLLLFHGIICTSRSVDLPLCKGGRTLILGRP